MDKMAVRHLKFCFCGVGYGLAFSFAILLTGWVSAFYNPALALAAWINGNGITSAGEYFAISISTVIGDDLVLLQYVSERV